jgi:general secretion pathway protein E
MITPTEHLPEQISIPLSFAKRYGVLLDEQQDNPQHLRVLYKNGLLPHAIIELRRHLGKPLQLSAIDNQLFEQRLQEIYETRANETMQSMDDDLDEELNLNQIAQALQEPEDLLESADDAPIIRLLNALFTEAIREGASDIHIETFEFRLRVRFRIDGVLREILQPKRALAPLIVSRIKVMARLDIAEKRLPQDGRFSLRLGGRTVDIRVSTIPAGQNERVVLRLLDKKAGSLDLEHLGMPSGSREKMNQLIAKPHGIILVTGPTGSGKTTTLYAALSSLNKVQRNIMTVEDPIEYYLDGINQTQVNSKVEMSFAKGLRAILRQDPDVVMVGEIRDIETAQIAVQASLTGHLVFSTLHTNTAIGAINRLRDMGIEPFLLASSLIGVLAQRLVRVLCADCKTAYSADASECQLLSTDPDQAPTLYRANGCESCNHTGFNGRTGLYELVDIDDTLRSHIHDQASEQKMDAYIAPHTIGVREQGYQKVLDGETTLDEVLRVAEEKSRIDEATESL